MFPDDSYQLLSFANGRKTERFGPLVVERPCPVAADEFDLGDEDDGDFSECESPKPDLRFTGRTGNGVWSGEAAKVDDWSCVYRLDDQARSIEFELAATPTGQVGIFPEQQTNWDWTAKRCAMYGRSRPPRILNLFAYTGGSTLAAAVAGAEVTHVDSAKSVVNWARRNAARSGLSDAPIRWIVEDAAKFVSREVKRGRTYDGIILDPPSYGHGPKREEWKLSRDLIGLLGDCKKLLSETPALFLLSCHTTGFGEPELNAALSTCLFGSCGAGVKTRRLDISSATGKRLPSGHAAYWP